ncbi:hypothetical protein HK096_010830, partial [Nowakowskiella sp. JEL0078]
MSEYRNNILWKREALENQHPVAENSITFNTMSQDPSESQWRNRFKSILSPHRHLPQTPDHRSSIDSELQRPLPNVPHSRSRHNRNYTYATPRTPRTSMLRDVDAPLPPSRIIPQASSRAHDIHTIATYRTPQPRKFPSNWWIRTAKYVTWCCWP